MAHVVCQPCLDCKYTDCVEVCPVDCFHEGDRMLSIDPDVCIDCAVCIPECPVEAIYPDRDVPEHWIEFVARNAIEAARYPVITTTQAPLPTAPPRSK